MISIVAGFGQPFFEIDGCSLNTIPKGWHYYRNDFAEIQTQSRRDDIDHIMAGTYSQIYIQYVFSVKGRENLLQKPWRDKVFKYISGIVKGKNQKPVIVNGVADHVHVFVGLKPAMNISDLVRDIKNNSSNFINEQQFMKGKFYSYHPFRVYENH